MVARWLLKSSVPWSTSPATSNLPFLALLLLFGPRLMPLCGAAAPQDIILGDARLDIRLGRTVPLPGVSTAYAAETVPLPRVSTAFAAMALPLPCALTAFEAKSLHYLAALRRRPTPADVHEPCRPSVFAPGSCRCALQYGDRRGIRDRGRADGGGG